MFSGLERFEDPLAFYLFLQAAKGPLQRFILFNFYFWHFYSPGR